MPAEQVLLRPVLRTARGREAVRPIPHLPSQRLITILSRMKIKKLPNILALHLKRFKYEESLQRHVKLTYRVVFPFELRLFNTADGVSNPDRLYELWAIVVHIGVYVASLPCEHRVLTRNTQWSPSRSLHHDRPQWSALDRIRRQLGLPYRGERHLQVLRRHPGSRQRIRIVLPGCRPRPQGTGATTSRCPPRPSRRARCRAPG